MNYANVINGEQATITSLRLRNNHSAIFFHFLKDFIAISENIPAEGYWLAMCLGYGIAVEEASLENLPDIFKNLDLDLKE